ncbi:DUF1016 N-terminal domain-containing protein [Dyadobacter sp. CY261]|uniref:DUF1016 N-terminal domain-containing protein n=1 Tax=Dyadobacter sp. CY261 TaxID=2907203 RepID=UPI001F3916C1|nr:DUF1016 N-terminal domain-containing protein [Dyadobacter sp. CY261]MCF0070298.1 DUF1016 N-terminal domain-containing protein [Dyadobacter sp. CY261]
MNKITNTALFSTVKDLILASRQHIAVSVNAEMSMLYWKIGTVVRQEIMKQERAEYGKQIVATLSRQLESEYGKSFSEKSLRRMIQFAELFPEEKIVVSVIRQLSWSHFMEILPILDPLKREFYIQMCIHERWSVRTFRERIQSMLYERTAISKKPEDVILNDLQLLKSNIRVADYLTALPSQEVLQRKLHNAVEIARHKLAQHDLA